MPSAESLLPVANQIALLGWLLLLLSPFAPRWSDRLAGYAIPALLSLGYALLMAVYWGDAEGGFGSLPDVMRLFTVPEIALAGWIHYLAFDLFIGAWQTRTARAEGIAFWLLLPCLALTFMLGPIGWLLFHALRAVRAARAA